MLILRKITNTTWSVISDSFRSTCEYAEPEISLNTNDEEERSVRRKGCMTRWKRFIWIDQHFGAESIRTVVHLEVLPETSTHRMSKESGNLSQEQKCFERTPKCNSMFHAAVNRLWRNVAEARRPAISPDLLSRTWRTSHAGIWRTRIVLVWSRNCSQHCLWHFYGSNSGRIFLLSWTERKTKSQLHISKWVQIL